MVMGSIIIPGVTLLCLAIGIIIAFRNAIRARQGERFYTFCDGLGFAVALELLGLVTQLLIYSTWWNISQLF